MEYYVKGIPSDEELKKIFESVKQGKKGVNVKKYAGKVRAKGNPVTLQRKLRNEWD
jgi:hypothetical protein